MSQEKGIVGRFVGSMIRRSVRNRFHTVYYRTEGPSLTSPTILYANHNGWMDGYLLFHLVSKVGLRCLDWIEEFDAFPLFAAVGGMRFSNGNIGARAMTVRKTIRLMKTMWTSSKFELPRSKIFTRNILLSKCSSGK